MKKKEFVWSLKFFLMMFFIVLVCLLSVLTISFFKSITFSDTNGETSDIKIVDFNTNN